MHLNYLYLKIQRKSDTPLEYRSIVDIQFSLPERILFHIAQASNIPQNQARPHQRLVSGMDGSTGKNYASAVKKERSRQCSIDEEVLRGSMEAAGIQVKSESRPSSSQSKSIAKNVERDHKDDRQPVELSLRELTFFTGNPAVEITHGIIHIYKTNSFFLLETENCIEEELSTDDTPAGLTNNLPETDIDTIQSNVLLLYAIPFDFTFQNVLDFLSPFQQTLKHIQVIQAASASHYMCLLRFSTPQAAKKFYYTMNKRPFSSLFSGEQAHIFFVAKVETCDGEPLIEYGITELPECIVCLERMDESVTGLNLSSTLLCNHSFHGKPCLKNWNSLRCPVCRYVQSPAADGYTEEMDDESRASDNHSSAIKVANQNRVQCSQCASGEKAQEYWICLVCGNVGCGRYDTNHHAADHFYDTGHNYAMSLQNNRVWDYQNDQFVHRLLQTSANNDKLVGKDCNEKPVEKQMLALEMECMQLLSQQLETQRQYWENRLFEEKMAWQISSSKNTSLTLESQTQTEISTVSADPSTSKDLELMQTSLDKMKSNYRKSLKNWQDEKAVSKALSDNMATLADENAGLKEQMRNLEELNRDLTFHMQAQQNTEIKEAIQDGTVVGTSPSKPKGSSSRKKRK